MLGVRNEDAPGRVPDEDIDAQAAGPSPRNAALPHLWQDISAACSNAGGLGNGLWMGFRDHYRDSRYFWYRLFDEKKIKI